MRTLVNPRPHPVRLVLSDGTERTVGAWGLAFVPERDARGESMEVERAEYLPGQDEGRPTNIDSRGKSAPPMQRAA